MAVGSAPRRRGAVWAVVTGIHAFKVRWLLAYFGERHELTVCPRVDVET